MPEKRDNLALANELFDFLQGTVPDGYKLAADDVPHLTPAQAWTVIWYLGNQYWQVPDHIERCDICGELFDSNRDGVCLDWGEAPYHACDDCEYDDAVVEKRSKGDPDE